MLIAAALVAAAAASPILTMREGTVALAGDALRLADVASLDCATARCRALGQRQIGRLSPGSSITLQEEDVAAMVRRAVPGAPLQSKPGQRLTILRSTKAAANALAPQCMELTAPISAGAVVEPDSVMVVACDGSASRAVRYDASRHANVATVGLAVGTQVPMIEGRAGPVVEKGAELELVSTSGPVTIRRRVTAAQPAQSSDRRLFVKDADGAVFAVPASVEVKEKS